MSSVKKVNKSEAIRNYSKENPTASPKEIAAALKSYSVSTQFVSTVLSNARKRGSKPIRRNPVEANQVIQGHKPLDLVRRMLAAADQLIEASGSTEDAIEAIKFRASMK